MAKGKLSEVCETTQRQAKNKVRKVFQTLQISADEQAVTEKSMVKPSDKIKQNDKIQVCKEKESKSNPKLILAEKENVTCVRRSKRKNAASSAISYAESPEVSKTTKSSVKSISKSRKSVKTKKGCATAVKKNEQTKLNQTKLQFSPVAALASVSEDPDECESDNLENPASTTYNIEITEDSGFDPSCGISDPSPMNSTAVLKSDLKSSPIPYKDSILTMDTPPLSYWRDLAEQRRIALEKALHENELLHDELTVLEAENSQLKQLVREAENLAQVLRAVVE